MSQTIKKKLNSLPLSMLLPLGCLLSYLGVGMTFFICRLELLSRDGFVVSSLTMVISFSQHWFWTFFQTIGLYFLLKYKIDISQVFPVRQLIFWRFFVSYVTADCYLINIWQMSWWSHNLNHNQTKHPTENIISQHLFKIHLVLTWA